MIEQTAIGVFVDAGLVPAEIDGHAVRSLEVQAVSKRSREVIFSVLVIAVLFGW